MKRLEMEYILLLIDIHTQKSSGYYGEDYKIMYGGDIAALKRDIKTFYEGHKDKDEEDEK